MQESLTNFSNRSSESFETVSEKNNTSFGVFLLRTVRKLKIESETHEKMIKNKPRISQIYTNKFV
jgi:hypothetical protein